MQDKRLILMVGVYDTLDIFTYELKNAFDKMGYETLVYDSRETGKSLAALAQFVQKPVTAVITFNNLGFNMELVEGRNLWEDLEIPCINILMDHPFCYKKALDNAPSNAVVLCIDRNHMRYLNRFYPRIGVTGFLPHAGKPLPGTKKKLSERSVDVMYAGGLSRAFADKAMPDLAGYDTLFDVKKFCRDVYDNVIEHPEKTTEQGIEEELLKLGVHVPDSELCQIIADFHFLDLHIVSHYREKVVAAVAKAGISLDLYGTGWEDCDWIELPNVNFHGRVSADEIVERMQEAKIVLNTMTWFKDGTHDRVFNGMLQKAVAVTDSSIYMREAFCAELNKINAELVMFELKETDALPDKIKYLLNNLDVAQQIADNGYERAVKSETWEARAKELDRDLFFGGETCKTMEDYYITNKNDMFMYIEALRRFEPESVLDIGMFLKRVGAISRSIGDWDISCTCLIDGVDFAPQVKAEVYSRVYDDIETWQDFRGNCVSEVEFTGGTDGNPAKFIDRKYTLAFLMRYEKFIGGEDLNSLFKWMSMHVEIVAIAGKFDDMEVFISKLGNAVAEVEPLKLGNDEYMMVRLAGG